MYATSVIWNTEHIQIKVIHTYSGCVCGSTLENKLTCRRLDRIMTSVKFYFLKLPHMIFVTFFSFYNLCGAVKGLGKHKQSRRFIYSEILSEIDKKPCSLVFGLLSDQHISWTIYVMKNPEHSRKYRIKNSKKLCNLKKKI